MKHIWEFNLVLTNFWEPQIWSFLIQCFILLTFIIIGNTLRRKVSFIKKSLLPTSVISGLLILILKSVWPWFNNLIDVDVASVLTYHTLALGFIAITLKSTDESKKKERSGVIIDTGIATVGGYLVQAITGIIITILCSLFIADLIPAAGCLLPMGFGQGPGQALSWGTIYENEYGFAGGASFGLSIAAAGFIVACIVGVIYLNILKHKGKIELHDCSDDEYSKTEVVATDKEIPLNNSIDKFTMQVVLVGIVYFVTYLVMALISWICDKGYLGNLGTNTIKPLIWGFNFLFGTLFAVLMKKIFKGLNKIKVMTHTYPSNYLLNRLSGFFFDLMIVSGIAAIEITDLQSLWIPLILLSVVGTVATFVYLKLIAGYLWPDYKYQGMMSMFGMLTGTASTGMILLREIDPEYDTPAAENLVFQSVPAILFGFPVILLMSLAPQSMGKLWITLGVCTLMFIVYNIIIFRKVIFKKKIKDEKKDI